MLKPLSSFVGGATRPFFNIDMRFGKYSHFQTQIDKRMVIENWFLAALPGDPLIVRTKSCVWKLQPRLKDSAANVSHHLLSTKMFSYRQWQEMASYGISAYMSTHACFFKSLDEDVGLSRWYFSNAVQHLDALQSAYMLPEKYRWATPIVKYVLFNTLKLDIVNDLLSPPSLVMKFNSVLRGAILEGRTQHELWCQQNNTFHELLVRLSVRNDTLCN